MTRQQRLVIAIQINRIAIRDRVTTVLLGFYAAYGLTREHAQIAARVEQELDFWAAWLADEEMEVDSRAVEQVVRAGMRSGVAIEQLASSVEQMLCIMVGLTRSALPVSDHDWLINRLYFVMAEVRASLLQTSERLAGAAALEGLQWTTILYHARR